MDESSGSQSIDRAAALLALVAERHEEGATLVELVRRTGLKQPTARRLLVALIRAGLIEQSEASRRYHLGISAYLYGTIASDRFAAHSLADESVRRLAERSGDTAFFSVRQGYSTLCLLREEGPHPIRSHVLNIGQRHPLGVAAHGIAILACLGDADVDAVIEANRGYYASHYPMLTEQVLRTLVAETRKRGFAINRGLFHQGAWAIGIAVRGPTGAVIGALSIGAIESRLNDERQPEIMAMLKAEARKLEARVAAVDTQGRTGAPPAGEAKEGSRTGRGRERSQRHAAST
ncbi:transcriptional regulator, IclR family [[Luteovulum] sphaeroides subsp. megalophilum]|uniref:IclR family transcriptional regulator n=1 Tax=Cereibacter sphaeroides TaxID=1063 RepID=UPI000B64933F|nr:IclR family transcriptional regulator [Cereibacter sphaeroides]SNT20415.1 transcriptional regulator, IclR family [[Luteovulum] sphaeroides subsp. megalophilum]